MLTTFIRRAADAIHALPLWVRIALAVQCTLPGVVFAYQLELLAHQSTGMAQLAA